MRNDNMSGCEIAGIVLAAIVVVGFALTVPDIVKYIRLKNM
jgi:hypothetical protein